MATQVHVDTACVGADLPVPSIHANYEATRYLCGAAYTDSKFRQKVIELGEDEVHARAHEVGIDISEVTRHCLKAESRESNRDYLLFLVLICTAAASLFNVYLALIAGWLISAVIIGLGIFGDDRIQRHDLAKLMFAEAWQARAVQPDDNNVIVYSGFSPFVGAGTNIGGWSFAVDLSRGKQGLAAHDPQPFTLAEIYDHVIEVFELLGLRDLSVSRKLFVSGRRVREEGQFLPNVLQHPVMHVPEEEVAKYAENCSRDVRHYLCVESVDWGGELAVSLFIRFQKFASKLFVEVSTSLLPPLKQSYYRLDKLRAQRPFAHSAGLLAGAIIGAPFFLLLAPFLCLGRVRTTLKVGRNSQLRDEIRKDPLFDYGAKESLREFAAGDEWRVYFQKLDKEMHHKILQQQLLDCLVDFLDHHGIDTSEIKERTTHILNNGVIVSGGSVTAEGLAVGEGAQARVSNVTKRVPAKAAA